MARAKIMLYVKSTNHILNYAFVSSYHSTSRILSTFEDEVISSIAIISYIFSTCR